MLQTILDEVVAREPIFHRPEFGTTRQDFEGMMDPNFWEVGASGSRYSKGYVLDVLEERHSKTHEDVWEAFGFHCEQIAPDNYLLTYTLLQGKRKTRRSTIWRRASGTWKILYHQGTVVEE